MREQIILEILSKCLDFMDVDQCNQLRLVLEDKLHNYNLEEICTDLVPSNQWQNKLLLYLASKKVEGLSDKTLKNYKLQLIDFARTIRKNFEEIDEMDIRLYIARTMERGIKNSTIATVISILKTFFTWMYDNNYVPKNPSKLIKNIKVDKFLRKPLSPEEQELLRDCCKTIRDKALFEFFYSTGARLDEIYKLNKSDIDWSTNSVIVFGKSRKEREVYLNAKSRVSLKKYLNKRIDNKEALFVSAKSPHNRLGKRSIEVFFSELGKKAGLERAVCPHRVRHTTATDMIQHGASITEIQSYLGHQDPATTIIYAQLNKEDVRIAHRKCLN